LFLIPSLSPQVCPLGGIFENVTPAIDSGVPNIQLKGSVKSPIRIAPIQMDRGGCRIIANDRRIARVGPRYLLCRKFAVAFPVAAAGGKKRQ
jgi:hypothetical protein